MVVGSDPSGDGAHIMSGSDGPDVVSDPAKTIRDSWRDDGLAKRIAVSVIGAIGAAIVLRSLG
jgi:hypothetical protein